MMDFDLYFVRHGQTDWNAEGRLQGQADTALNALGRQQATRNGARLATLISDPSAYDFVASPLGRTRETMEIIRREIGLDPAGYRTDPRLVEVHFGDWQGFTIEELEQANPGCTRSRDADKWHFLPPGDAGESYARLTERLRPWFSTLSRPTVCVTHGGVVRSVHRMVEALDEDASAMLSVPQDRVLRLRGRTLEWL